MASRRGRDRGYGVFDLEQVSDGYVTGRATAGKRTVDFELAPGAREAVVTVERPGSVVIELDPKSFPEGVLQAQVLLRTADSGWPDWSRMLDEVRQMEGRPLRFDEVAPGLYELLWAAEDTHGFIVELSTPLPVWVTPGGTARVAL